MKLDDRIRVQHMIDAAQEAISFVRDVTQKDFSDNRILLLSVMKEIEIIGEAAARISDEIKLKYTEIPWQDIIGMRNRLVHGYFEVNTVLLWNTIKKNIPELIDSLKRIVDKI